VKVRGFRVEVGEIEAVLSRHPMVRQAAVVAREEEGRGRTLAACVVVSEGLEPGEPEQAVAAELQRFLRERLPEPMVPSAWTFVPELPLTPNGKVDRRALVGMVGEGGRAVEHVAPRTPLEEHLVEVCAEVLGLDPGGIGIRDNFFDLGGHSLLATRFAAVLRETWDIEMPLALLFNAANFSDLADDITERELADIDPELLAEMMVEIGDGDI
jgi:acyl carrier protein